MKQNIWGYIMAQRDDQDVLMDALRSMARIANRIILVDGIEPALSHNPRFTAPLSQWLRAQGFDLSWHRQGYTTLVGGTPLLIHEHFFDNPGKQRNYVEKELFPTLILPDGNPDWIYWHDADEIASWELINQCRRFLLSLSEDVKTVVPKWLNLVENEGTMVSNHSDWLAHGRFFRPNTISWSGTWHEHQYMIDGSDNNQSRVQLDARVIHTRALYRWRLWKQRGHPLIRGEASEGSPLWDNAETDDVPIGTTWEKLTWPQGEVRDIPFDEDVRNYYDAAGVPIRNYDTIGL